MHPRDYGASDRREADRYDKEIDILGLGGCGLVLIRDSSGSLYVSYARTRAGLRPAPCVSAVPMSACASRN